VGVHAERIQPFVGSPQYVYSDEFVSREDGMPFLIEGAPMFPMTLGSIGMALGTERQAQMELLPYSVAHGRAPPRRLRHERSRRGRDRSRSLTSGGRPKIDYKWTERLSNGLRDACCAALRIQLAAGARQAFTVARRLRRAAPDEIDAAARRRALGPLR
jgi:hypothetical protein